jgi:Xaa-Pro aminopeptidase
MLKKGTVLLLSITIVFGLAIPETNSQQIDFEVFKQRRDILCDSLGDGIAVLYSTGYHTETGYRADGNFYYLTGINDPGAILVLVPEDENKHFLLLEPRDPEKERWTGFRHTLSDSLETAWGFDYIGRINRIGSIVTRYLKKTSVLHFISSLQSPSKEIPPDMELYSEVQSRIPNISIKNSSRFIERMRMVKSQDEIDNIKKAIDITHQGITELLAEVQPGITEFQLDGILEKSFKEQGAQHMAFPAIVGYGEQGTILHYEKRDQILEAGELLLLDVGAEWEHYCADISRTIPIDGKFTDRQSELYDLVLKAQDVAFSMIKPGVTLEEISDAAEKIIKDAGYIDFYLHGISHHLGLDVHDKSDRFVPLAPGMVITVEPGLYIDSEGIGIRIEDDVLVTENGYNILSKNIPRYREDVEKWMTKVKNNK